MYKPTQAKDLPPDVKAVLRELKTEECQSNGRQGALGKRVKFNEKGLGCYSTVGAVSDNYCGITTEVVDHVIFSNPQASRREPVRYQIAKQED
jgi:hypothetical protein